MLLQIVLLQRHYSAMFLKDSTENFKQADVRMYLTSKIKALHKLNYCTSTTML